MTYGEITTLEHEIGNYAVEFGALVVEGFSTISFSLLSSAECSEILSSLRNDISVQSHDNASCKQDEKKAMNIFVND